jgi:rod shape-determining protein MreD
MTVARLAAFFALVTSLALTVLPLPAPISAFRPDWVAALLLYWSVVAPHRFGLGTAFVMGCALDVLTGALLGQNALALIVIIYLSQRFHLRIRAFPLSQIAGTVFILLTVYEFTLFWIDGVAGRLVPAMDRMGGVLSTTVLLTIALSVRERGDLRTKARIEA